MLVRELRGASVGLLGGLESFGLLQLLLLPGVCLLLAFHRFSSARVWNFLFWTARWDWPATASLSSELYPLLTKRFYPLTTVNTISSSCSFISFLDKELDITRFCNILIIRYGTTKHEPGGSRVNYNTPEESRNSPLREERADSGCEVAGSRWST